MKVESLREHLRPGSIKIFPGVWMGQSDNVINIYVPGGGRGGGVLNVTFFSRNARTNILSLYVSGSHN